MAAVDFNYFLNRKYAQLQQQADATTMNAKTNALAGAAAARLDSVRADLLPAESREGLLKSASERGLIDQQASVVVPESRARVAQMGAETDLTRTQNRVAVRQGLTPIGSLLGGPAGRVLQNQLTGGAPMVRVSEITPSSSPRMRRAQGNNPSAADLDWLNGLGS